MLKVGDLVYAPSEVKLLKFHEHEHSSAPQLQRMAMKVPARVHQLKAPTNLLLTQTKTPYGDYLKVLYDGDEWYVEEKDINTIERGQR